MNKIIHIEENKDTFHAARLSEGLITWAKVWNATWDQACRSAMQAERLAIGRSMSRTAWAAIMVAARDSIPPAASDAKRNEQWTAAWNAAWVAAWSAAVVAVEDRIEKDPLPPRIRPWDATSRAARAAAGRDAGCAAWNEAYHTEIKKVIN